MAGYGFRAHVAVDASSEREGETIFDGFLDHAREANDADGPKSQNFTAELDEGSAEILEDE